MGVNGLWKLLEPVGRPITLESLENKTLAVDVSVWLNQAVYGMRSQHGSTVPNAHLVLLFQRICKLLYYRIKPIFVFDGGVPELKKKTMAVRRSMRLSARNKAQKISESVLKKYLKSRAISNVTGRRRSQRSSTVLNQQEPEKDLFELPPLPQEKEDKSPSEEGSFFQSHILQDTEDVNIDSEEFKNLPHEIQHEVIVEMHEKSKRHSRYQDLHMPEESHDFSNFQLNHLLKRGKLTQRLGTIRKEMNEKRVGELVTNIADNGMTVNSTIQSQKIMSEETGHYILIKKTEARGKDDHEEEEDKMAGGFFREDTKDVEIEFQPFVLTDLPKISSKIAKPSVSVALDEAASSTDESSDEHEFEDIADDSRVLPGESADLLLEMSNIVSTPEFPVRDLPSPNSSERVQIDQVMEKGDTEYSNTFVRRGNSYSRTGTSVVLDDFKKALSNKNGRNLGGEIETVNVDVQDSMKEDNQEIHDSKSPTVSQVFKNGSIGDVVLEESSISTSVSTLPKSSDVGERKSEEKAISDKTIISAFDTELNDLEDEINQKKRLIEKLLADRRMSTMTESQSCAKGSVENVTLKDKGFGNEEQDVDISLEHESEFKNNESRDAESNLPTAMDIRDDNADSVGNIEASRLTENDVPPQNEFEGVTYEELGEMQMKLDEDLDNLREERSRQTRLAATVTDEMYKDSQELLQLFGIPYVVSPMEAEAQCATLDNRSLCDGSITEDSDIILFGAKKVYKNVFNQRQHAELYQEEDVKCQLGLDRVNLIAMALLTGSDYTEGVQGVGIVSAMEIINEFSGEGIEKLQNLKNWLQDKSKYPLHESELKKKLKNILLPVGFPSQQVFEAYLNPAVDDSSEPFSWASPDLHSLRLFASEKLGWSKTKADEILLPVLKRLNSKETQTKIDSFFPVQFNENRKIKSRRIKRVVNRLLNKQPDDNDADKQIVKKRKVKDGESREVSGKQNQKGSSDIDNHDQCNPGRSDTSTKCTLLNMPVAPQRSREESGSDSTSDTSDEDQSCVPFNTKVVSVRGRGMPRGGVGVSGLRGSQRKRKCARKKKS